MCPWGAGALLGETGPGGMGGCWRPGTRGLGPREDLKGHRGLEGWGLEKAEGLGSGGAGPSGD